LLAILSNFAGSAQFVLFDISVKKSETKDVCPFDALSNAIIDFLI